MTTYKKNSIVTLGDSAYIAKDAVSGTPGVDPLWALLARGVPAPGPEGRVLTVVGGKWAAALPTGGSGGEGGGGDGTPAALHQIQAGTASVFLWARNGDAQWGLLTSDGEVLTLTSNYASQFVRYAYNGERLPAPFGLAAVELAFDVFVPTADSADMSVGIALTSDGDAGHFNFRIDIHDDGTFGCRFERDGQANIFSTDGAGPFTRDEWHRVRFLRHNGSAAALIDDVLVAGTDEGPTEVDTANGITLLMYGGSTGNSLARFRNITATTYLGLGGGGSGGSGTPGAPGESAYDIAVDNGFGGTPTQWLASLKGAKGDPGDPGGGGGGTGAPGESAYQIAVDEGFVGTEPEWLASLKGAPGDPGEPGDPGAPGASAYERAVTLGFVGTEAEWIASLQGVEGKSAFDVAVIEGFVGTEAEWVASLKGAKGDPGTPGAGGTGGGNGPLVVGPSNSLTMPGLWMETDNNGNFIQWWFDDHNGVGGSNTNGAVSFGPTNGLQVAGLWIQTDENLVPQMMYYDDGTH